MASLLVREIYKSGLHVYSIVYTLVGKKSYSAEIWHARGWRQGGSSVDAISLLDSIGWYNNEANCTHSFFKQKLVVGCWDNAATVILPPTYE